MYYIVLYLLHEDKSIKLERVLKIVVANLIFVSDWLFSKWTITPKLFFLLFPIIDFASIKLTKWKPTLWKFSMDFDN